MNFPELAELRADVRGTGVDVRLNASPRGGVVVNLRSNASSWHVRVWAPSEDDAIAAARAAWSELR